ncbi:hypothetical protein OEZ85_011581 [Tetradesmus obliquus]|uniref:Uncharacterized protein n=1 Tax=Tetradesmus obliquus TaxID=3088 RepID=A0ABY8TR62_TETOB|nr:hypothetical protein OEZ85_011581 [Tetradesmus obliquus]
MGDADETASLHSVNGLVTQIEKNELSVSFVRHACSALQSRPVFAVTAGAGNSQQLQQQQTAADACNRLLDAVGRQIARGALPQQSLATQLLAACIQACDSVNLLSRAVGWGQQLTEAIRRSGAAAAAAAAAAAEDQASAMLPAAQTSAAAALRVQQAAVAPGAGGVSALASLQVAAYQALLASVLVPSSHRPPFLGQALLLYRQGRSSSSPALAAVCQAAALQCEVLLHPRAAAISSVRQYDGMQAVQPLAKPRMWSAVDAALGKAALPSAPGAGATDGAGNIEGVKAAAFDAESSDSEGPLPDIDSGASSSSESGEEEADEQQS